MEILKTRYGSLRKRGYASEPRQIGEDASPNASVGSAIEAIAEGTFGDRRHPPDCLLLGYLYSSMGDTRQHAGVIYARHDGCVGRQKGLDPRPLRIRKRKEIRNPPRFLAGER